MSRMNRCALWVLPAALGLGFLLAPRASLAAPGYVHLMFGQKVFDSEDWDPIDKQASFGAEGVFGPASWPVQMDAYVSRASGSKDQVISGVQGNLDADTWEFGFGANKTFGKEKFHPYVNAGLVHVKVSASFSQGGTSGSDEEKAFGFWGGGGVFYRLGSAFHIGGAARYSVADVDFNAFTSTIGNVSFSGSNVKAGGLTFGVLVGWGWPKIRG